MRSVEKSFERVREIGPSEPDKSPDKDSHNDPIDLRPEFCFYKDEGCKLAKSCLKCPFPRCVDDQLRGRRKWLREHRDKEIVRLRIVEKKLIREIAADLNVTKRTVYNALKAYREKQNE